MCPGPESPARMPMNRNASSSGAPKRSASRLERMPAITRTAPSRMAMLTWSRDAMRFRRGDTKWLALHPYRRHDWTPRPFLPTAAKCPILRSYLAAPRCVSMAGRSRFAGFCATIRITPDGADRDLADGHGSQGRSFIRSRHGAAVRGADHLALVLSAVRPDPGGRRHCAGAQRRRPRPRRYELAGAALAATAPAFRARDGFQRLDRRVRGADGRQPRHHVAHHMAKPELPVDGRSQARTGVACDPARHLGDPERLHRSPGVDLRLGGRGAKRHWRARLGRRYAGFGCDRG